MASKADEIIRIRNEGAVAYEKLIEQFGHAEAKKMLAKRVVAKFSIAIPAEELSRSTDKLTEAIINAYMAMLYTTLHDVCGYGKKRLHRFKQAFDQTALICFQTDNVGRRYTTVKDCAEEMNRLYDMGLNLSTIEDVEENSGVIKNQQCSTANVYEFLKTHGQKEAADLFWNNVYGKKHDKERARTKEQRAIAKRRRKEDRKYRDPNMNMFDPEVSMGYLAIIAKVLTDAGMTEDQIVDACGAVNETLTGVLEYGKGYLDNITHELESTFAFE